MPRRRVPLEVYLNGRHVGRLEHARAGGFRFQYTADWLAWEHALPVSLSLPLQEDAFQGEIVAAVFDNLLPDPEPMRRRIAEGLGTGGSDWYSLLEGIGGDCVGALQFLPEGVAPWTPDQLQAEPVRQAGIAEILQNLGRHPLGLSADGAFRISLAGAQEKTAFLFMNARWHRPRGGTPTSHIFKPAMDRLPSGIDLRESVENEFLCLKILEGFGLAVPKVSIQRFDETPALVVERFDRQWVTDDRLVRLPQEDCCQALGVTSSGKYDAEGGPGMVRILRLLAGSDTPEHDRRQFLTAQILFWLLAATDGHAKNFSLFLYPGGRFRLAPFYDVISVQPMLDGGRLRTNQARMAMAVGRNRHYRLDEILLRHFQQTARQADMAENVLTDIAADIIQRADTAMEHACRALPESFPERIFNSLRKGLRSRLPRLEA